MGAGDNSAAARRDLVAAQYVVPFESVGARGTSSAWSVAERLT
jgi:hypothetical protein